MNRDRFPVVAHVLLVRGDRGAEVFLLRRAGTGIMDGYYGLPGGHQRAGEGVREAARRECLEETGVDPAVLAPVCVLAYGSARHRGLNVVFEVDGSAAAPGLAEPERSDAAGWFGLDALPNPVVPWLQDVLELRRRGEWYRELYTF